MVKANSRRGQIVLSRVPIYDIPKLDARCKVHIEETTVGYFTIEDLEALNNAQRGRCAYCGIEFGTERYNKFQIDHFIPKSKGGTNWIDNIRLVCPICNRRKKDKMPDAWLACLTT